jgi:hypothetical protein
MIKFINFLDSNKLNNSIEPSSFKKKNIWTRKLAIASKIFEDENLNPGYSQLTNCPVHYEFSDQLKTEFEILK